MECSGAPEMFQKIREQILAECEGTINFIDDILIFGESTQEHDKNLNKTLSALKENNVLLNDSKCSIRTTETKFLGYHQSAEGIKPSKEYKEVIKKKSNSR